MNKLYQRYLRFLALCIPTRISLIFLSGYLKDKKILKNIFNIITLCIGIGFTYIYFFGSKTADSQLVWANEKTIWWNDLRIAHGLNYLFFSYFYFTNNHSCCYFLILDVILGLLSFSNHHFLSNIFKKL